MIGRNFIVKSTENFF